MQLDLTDAEQAKLDALYAALKEAESGYTDIQSKLVQLQAQMGLIQGRYLGAIEMVAATKDHAPEDVTWAFENEHVTLTIKET